MEERKKERGFCEVQFATGQYFYLLYLQRKICVGEVGALFFFVPVEMPGSRSREWWYSHFVCENRGMDLFFLFNQLTMLTPFRHLSISVVGPNFAVFDKCWCRHDARMNSYLVLRRWWIIETRTDMLGRLLTAYFSLTAPFTHIQKHRKSCYSWKGLKVENVSW